LKRTIGFQAVKALIEAKANVNARSIGFIFLVFFLDVRSGEKRDAGIRARAHARACTRARVHAQEHALFQRDAHT